MKLFINKILHLFQLMRVRTNEKIIYLTFDDGPEEDITNWVLEILNKYNAKATFFCTGANANKYSQTLQSIVANGHQLGNHTYSHINSFITPTDAYVSDTEKADNILHTHLFRPPWGSITLSAFLRLRKKYKIVYWSLVSGDTIMKGLELESNMQRLYKKTKPGDIVLFHSCKRHENETKKILPLYLEWLKSNGYCCEILK